MSYRELKDQVDLLESQYKSTQCQLAKTMSEIKLFALGEMTNLSCEDTARWNTASLAIDAIRNNHIKADHSNWMFFVTSISMNIVFSCHSPVQYVSKQELYELVVAHLPPRFCIGELRAPKTPCDYTFVSLPDYINLAGTFTFTCI